MFEKKIPTSNPSSIEVDRVLAQIINKAKDAREKNEALCKDGKPPSSYFDFASIAEIAGAMCDAINSKEDG